MKTEISIACEFWVERLRKSQPTQFVLDIFRESLERALTSRYESHWHESDVLRGSGYRSLSYQNRVDSSICQAAKEAGIRSIDTLLQHVRGQTMFVNPGEVKILVDGAPTPTYLYRATSRAQSPASSSSPISTSSSPPASPCLDSLTPRDSPTSLFPPSPSSGFAPQTITQILWERYNLQYENQFGKIDLPASTSTGTEQSAVVSQ